MFKRDLTKQCCRPTQIGDSLTLIYRFTVAQTALAKLSKESQLIASDPRGVKPIPVGKFISLRKVLLCLFFG